MVPANFGEGITHRYDLEQHTLSLLASHQLGQHCQLSGVLYYQSPSDWINGDETDDYTRLDLRLARDIRLGESQGRLALVIQNLGGELHRVPGAQSVRNAELPDLQPAPVKAIAG